MYSMLSRSRLRIIHTASKGELGWIDMHMTTLDNTLSKQPSTPRHSHRPTDWADHAGRSTAPAIWPKQLGIHVINTPSCNESHAQLVHDVSVSSASSKTSGAVVFCLHQEDWTWVNKNSARFDMQTSAPAPGTASSARGSIEIGGR